MPNDELTTTAIQVTVKEPHRCCECVEQLRVIGLKLELVTLEVLAAFHERPLSDDAPPIAQRAERIVAQLRAAVSVVQASRGFGVCSQAEGGLVACETCSSCAFSKVLDTYDEGQEE